MDDDDSFTGDGKQLLLANRERERVVRSTCLRDPNHVRLLLTHFVCHNRNKIVHFAARDEPDSQRRSNNRCEKGQMKIKERESSQNTMLSTIPLS